MKITLHSENVKSPDNAWTLACTPVFYVNIWNVWRELSNSLDLAGIGKLSSCLWFQERLAVVSESISRDSGLKASVSGFVSFSCNNDIVADCAASGAPTNLCFFFCFSNLLMVQHFAQGHMCPMIEPTTAAREITLPSVPQTPPNFLQPPIMTPNVHVHMPTV